MPYSVKKTPFKTLPCFIPEQIASIYGIKAAVFVGRLYALSNGRGSCFYESDDIKKQLKIDRGALTNILKQLQSVGILSYKLMKWKKDKIGGTHNIYTLNLHHPLLSDLEGVCMKHAEGVCMKHAEGCAQNMQRGVHVSYDHNTENNTENNTETERERSGETPEKILSPDEIKSCLIQFNATTQGEPYRDWDLDTSVKFIHDHCVANGISIKHPYEFISNAVMSYSGLRNAQMNFLKAKQKNKTVTVKPSFDRELLQQEFEKRRKKGA